MSSEMRSSRGGLDGIDFYKGRAQKVSATFLKENVA